MKDKHIIDKLFNIVVILVILFSTVFLYNSLINYLGREDNFYSYQEYEEYFCGESEDGYKNTYTLEECPEKYESEKKESEASLQKTYKVNIITTLGIIVISIGFLILINKKDFLKTDIGLKILNAILLLISFGALLSLYGYVVSSVFYDYSDIWLSIFRILGFIIFPIIFYIVINKYLDK